MVSCGVVVVGGRDVRCSICRHFGAFCAIRAILHFRCTKSEGAVTGMSYVHMTGDINGSRGGKSRNISWPLAFLVPKYIEFSNMTTLPPNRGEQHQYHMQRGHLFTSSKKGYTRG